MDTMYYVSCYLGALALIGTIAYFMRECLILMKRPAELTELKHHIVRLTGNDLHEAPSERLQKCEHIMLHYGIELREAGFDGSMRQLRRKAYVSYRRYIRANRKALIGNIEYHQSEDDPTLAIPSVDGRDQAESLRILDHNKRKHRLEIRRISFLSSSTLAG